MQPDLWSTLSAFLKHWSNLDLAITWVVFQGWNILLSFGALRVNNSIYCHCRSLLHKCYMLYEKEAWHTFKTYWVINPCKPVQLTHEHLVWNFSQSFNFLHVKGPTTSWFRCLFDKMDFKYPSYTTSYVLFIIMHQGDSFDPPFFSTVWLIYDPSLEKGTLCELRKVWTLVSLRSLRSLTRVKTFRYWQFSAYLVMILPNLTVTLKSSNRIGLGLLCTCFYYSILLFYLGVPIRSLFVWWVTYINLKIMTKSYGQYWLVTYNYSLNLYSSLKVLLFMSCNHQDQSYFNTEGQWSNKRAMMALYCSTGWYMKSIHTKHYVTWELV